MYNSDASSAFKQGLPALIECSTARGDVDCQDLGNCLPRKLGMNVDAAPNQLAAE